MDSILMAIQPKYCWKIIHGLKTIEIRKIRPNSETPFKCFIYCTKKYILELRKNGKLIRLDGKVIGEFICDKIEQLSEKDLFFGMDETRNSIIEDFSCVSIDELLRYKGEKQYLYGLHISDLKIYDKPKELSDFGKFECKDCGPERECFAPKSILSCSLQRADLNPKHTYNMWKCDCEFIPLKRPPQSWCYVKELKGESNE